MNTIARIIHSYLSYLIPKETCPQSFIEIRIISLSNFSCKIISKLLNTRMVAVIHKMVSANQVGFLKDKFITKNIMFTQEVVHNIKKSSASGTVIMKSDMAKVFDIVNQKYLCQVHRQSGLSEGWTNILEANYQQPVHNQY